MERGLEHLLTQRYDETLRWIDKLHSECLEVGGGDDTIVEKIVSLIPEELETQPANPLNPLPQIQLHDPHAPDISRYFLVFRQGCNDYARLCVEKKVQGNGASGKRGKETATSIGGPSKTADTAGGGAMVLDAPAVMPLDSVNPISATSTVLSTSVSAADLGEVQSASNSNSGHLRQSSHNSWLSSTSTSGSPVSSSSSVGGNSPGPQTTTANGSYHSFRLYRTYASFYHTLASGAEKGGMPRVQTQRQTSEFEAGEALKESKSKKTPATGNCANTNNPALDAALAWKGIKAQIHTFRGHPLPSPEIPCDTEAPVAAKHAIFAVHGVGQRAFRKMGFHFNKDCDELRNVLLDAAQARGLPTGSVIVFPVCWRAELNLAGNFSFGDDEDSETEIGRDRKDSEPVKSPSPKIDKDLQQLSESFNAGLDASSAPFQRAVSVFQGQFNEVFERLALESIPAVRSVLSDATMDILLYVSHKHFKKIMGAVVKEVIRLHKLFSHWHPNYEGEFSFLGHSLGSALVADLLSYTVQPDDFLQSLKENRDRPTLEVFMDKAEGNFLPFKIDKFFAFGSPLGIFHLLKHTKPIGCLRSPNILAAIAERSRKWKAARRQSGGKDVQDVPDWTVYNCRLFYNVFHPHDPVAHRFESLSMPRSRANNDANPSSTGSSGNKLPPPLKIPYHKSGLTRFKMDVEAKIARAKDDWAKLTFKLPTWLGGNVGEKGGDTKERGEEQEDEKDAADESSAITCSIVDDNPLAAFNHHFRRVDFSLQDSVMENPYISALGAHFIYWTDLDIAAFIVSELIKKERD